MESTRGAFKTKDGIKVFSQYWAPENSKAVVLQVHGLGEHSGRYAHVAAFFNAAGIAFYGYDHHGHGRSEGKRGHIPDYEVLMEEIDLAIADIAKLFPGKPVVLYGHSWGGNITLNYLLRRKPDVLAAIVTDPWLHIPKVPAIQETMARIVNGLFPGLTQNNGIDSKLLCTDPKVVKAYNDDPLVHPKISVRNFVSSDEAAKWALAHAAELQTPLLLMHGEKDLVTLPSGSEAFANANMQKVKFKIWPGLFHEIHNEPVQQEVFAEMLAFLQPLP